jgi:hypothetical protein
MLPVPTLEMEEIANDLIIEVLGCVLNIRSGLVVIESALVRWRCRAVVVTLLARGPALPPTLCVCACAGNASDRRGQRGVQV